MAKKLVTFIAILIVSLGAFVYFAPKAEAPKNNDDPAKSDDVPVKVENVTSEKSVSFLFAGDMMFDRYVYHSFKNIGLDHIFDNLDKTLFDQDIVFANLEGPVSETKIVDDHPERSLVFNMPPETIPTIKNLGINGVSLANNHTLNAGASGFSTTQTLLKNAGIKYGGSQNGFDARNIIRYESDIPVSIVTVDFLAYDNISKINEFITAEKNAGRFVIVFPHWGEEYSLTHVSSQEKAAKSWIDDGVDMIIGSHPHVVEDIEIYNNKPIIYSLGNFVFDQTFSKDTQEGLIVTGKITETNLEISLHPVQSVKLKPQLSSDLVKNELLKRILPINSAQNVSILG